ncbi:undecaprenyl-phosphate glucose phosphotransferase [Ferriphaselus sp. R-1]|uniref:undecaprenyl-phosphate glucose phosphotransferase n=1 Tax=Ferriphaselus sp. R-1 TaxID=1485544 RepID=UPI00055421BA|nr:undecaprenyl-phosphate glucose phosphotransferase [Ferriphaselus sp. R-1]
MKLKTSGLLRPYASEISYLLRLFDVSVIAFSMLFLAWKVGYVVAEAYMLAVAAAIILYSVVAELRGLYGSWRMRSAFDEAREVVLVWATALVGLIVLAFMLKISADFSRRLIGAWSVTVPLVLLGSRLLIRGQAQYARSRGVNTRVLAFVGAGNTARKMADRIAAAPWMGLRVAGVYDDREIGRLSLNRLSLIGNTGDMLRDAREGKLDYVYITLPMYAETRIVQLVDALADTTTSVYVVPDSFVFDLMHASWGNLAGMPVVSIYESPFYGIDGTWKRLEDLVIGTAILMLISPLMLFIALGIKLTSAGPVIFKQRRYGLNGEVVEVWKFRSMTVCEDGESVVQASKGDRRVTPFGAFLRRTSLDELPQFINVLQGRMSIVGPRPHAVAHNEEYRRLIHGYMLRHKVKPGITGWAQVNGWRGETDTLEKMKGRVDCDLEYVRNWSLGLDIKIILMTVFKGFVGKNVY